jgi:hypothetical protein
MPRSLWLMPSCAQNDQRARQMTMSVNLVEFFQGERCACTTFDATGKMA